MSVDEYTRAHSARERVRSRMSTAYDLYTDTCSCIYCDFFSEGDEEEICEKSAAVETEEIKKEN